VLTVAYLANQFPSAVEPYVGDEIMELRRRGVCVVTGSVRKSQADHDARARVEVILHPVSPVILLQAVWLCLRRWRRISPLVVHVIFGGGEGPVLRAKALLHTWLGACYAVRLEAREVTHIHVHHGYFGSWIAMVASRLLGVGFSMTLHGSDLLLHGAYLDVKLQSCTFCRTVSEYNRKFILDHYPGVEPEKVVVSRLGVEVGCRPISFSSRPERRGAGLVMLAVGRLHAVKDHAFLVQACAELYQRGVEFECSIAGAGPERRRLESLIRKRGLDDKVTLLGHVPRGQVPSLYNRADVVVLTSLSEGLPLVLMEAMARGKIVLAPAITGIPELVAAGKTGFLYEAGSLDDFVARLLFIRSQMQEPDHPHPQILPAGFLSAARPLDWVRHAAQVQVRHNFNRRKNLESFGELFIQQIAAQAGSLRHENSVLQQVQLSVQRHRSLPV
jgi:colanic acid/amylovoran biosynthesis glycosyltransferase